MLVAPGTYFENNILFGGKAITVQSSGGSSVTTIDGNAAASVVTFTQNEGPASILSGFTVTNGSAPQGGGIVISQSSPTIIGCRIVGNTAASNGGGAVVLEGSPLFQDCVFSGNTATDGGGLHLNGAFQNGGVTPIISACEFMSNTASKGGGAFCRDEVAATFSDCVFTANVANVSGAIMAVGAIGVIDRCTFFQNSADGGLANGGAIYASNASISSNLTIRDSVFSQNSTLNGGGNGGGGAISVDDSVQIGMTNCVVTANTTTGANGGGGLLLRNSAVLSMTNSVVVGNQSSNPGGGLRTIQSPTATISNSVFWDNLPQQIDAPTATVDHCDVQGGWTGSGGSNIDANPLFVNSLGGDFHLSPASPCIDAGNNADPNLPATDFDGDPRILGAAVDIGADEFLLPPPPYLGSLEDFALETSINGVATPAFSHVNNATVGDSFSVHFESPGGAYDSTVPFLVVQQFTTGSPPLSPAGYPELHFDPSPFAQFAPIVVFNGQVASPLGPFLLPAGGLTLSGVVPIGLMGMSVIVQAVVAAPSSIQGNPFFTATDAHEIQVQ